MPNWAKSAIIYQVFIDRFAGFDAAADDTKPERCGGNLRGIITKLPYLSGLGVTVIWLSPFFKSSDYHGYSTVDFFTVDSHMGTQDDLVELVKRAHQAGIKVLIDFTANHVSEHHPFFIAAKSDLSSPYRSWFYFDNHGNYERFLSFGTLPKLNLSNPPTRQHLIDAALYWLGQTGVDGLRLDHVIGPDHDFWQSFSQAIKAKFPNALLVGEAAMFGMRWRHLRGLRVTRRHFLYAYSKLNRRLLHDPIIKQYTDVFDGCLDFSFRILMQQFGQSQIDEQQLLVQLKRHYARFPREFVLPSFLDSHDKSRYLYLADNDINKLKRAAEIQFAQNQPKVIYYGTEVGMTHETKVHENSGWAGDLPARHKMNWQPYASQQELFVFYQNLIRQSKQVSPSRP